MQVMETSFDYLNAPILRVAAEDSPVPCSKPLEEAMLPNAGKIVKAVTGLLEQY
jgi:pyruvate/2-oxoglutarate/acetoin dehydrogenase E1 component